MLSQISLKSKILLIGLSLSLIGSLNNPTIAQSQKLTYEQIPAVSKLSKPTMLNYSDRVNNALNFDSFQYKGRRFASYQFQGKARDRIRITVLGGVASERDPNQIQLNSLLVNPVLILLDSQGNMIAQKPDSTDQASVLIRMDLPRTGKYIILVTSGDYNTGGRYTLSLEKLKPDGSDI